MSEEFKVVVVGPGWVDGILGEVRDARMITGSETRVNMRTSAGGWTNASLVPGDRYEVRRLKPAEVAERESAEVSGAVNHPEHYNMGPKCECGRVIECITVVRDKLFSVGNAMKYLWRAGEKAEAGLSALEKERQDLAKAEWYCRDRGEELDNLIAEEKKNADRD